jgi:hypothetical protein
MRERERERERERSNGVHSRDDRHAFNTFSSPIF